MKKNLLPHSTPTNLKPDGAFSVLGTKFVKSLISILAILLTTSSFAQMVFEDWAESRGTQNTFVTGKSFTDSNSNVYQVGATLNEEGDYDAIITKVDRYGDEVWTRTFDGSGGDDLFTDVQVSPSGKVVATGISGSANGLQSSVITAQLNATNGTSTWTQYYSYSGSVYNGGASITTDGSSNVYVGGATTSISTLGDVLVLKYNDGGTMQWANKKDMHGLDDGAVKVRLNGANVVASGAAQYNATSWRFLTTNFNASTGAFVNASEGTNNATSIDQIKDMVLDASGNIYVTGTAGTSTQGYNMHTIKLDEDLNVVWNHSYNFSGSYDDVANSIALDNSNNVVIAGTSALAGGNTQFTTVKYSNAGSVIWSQAYDITAGADSAKAIATDGSGNIYVSGNFSNGSNLDLKTIKYSPSGQLLWEIDFNNTSNTDDRVLDMTCDDGVVIVAQSGSGVNRTYTTVKYVEINYSPAVIPGLDGAMAHGFGANLGQVRDEDGESTAEVVKYYASQAGNSGFYRDNGFDFITRTAHGDTTLADTVQKVAFNFHAPQTGSRVRAFEKAAYFENHYLGANLPKLERIPFYENLLYDKPWNKITLEISTRSGRDYRFTVQPTAKPDDIKLNISGADSIAIDPSGDFKVYTFQGAITFPKPKAYQANGQGVLVELGWSPSYAYTGSQLRLSGIGSYNQQLPLVIRIGRQGDVEEADGFCHSTYFGGQSDDRIFDGAVNSFGEPIICGTTGNRLFYLQSVGILVNTGQQIFNADQGFAALFDRDFVPRFMTLFHGNAGVIFNALDVNNSDNIFLGGFTSANNLNTFNQIEAIFSNANLNGNSDGYIALLNGGDGTALWTTYFGGGNSSTSPGIFGTDVIYDLAVDSQDRLYIVGSASDANDFPLEDLDGAFFEDDFGPNPAFMARFKDDLSLEWSTLFGGSSNDCINAIAIGTDDRIAVAGTTFSSDLSIDQVSGTTQDLQINGSTDFFLAEFDANGAYQWGTYEGGTGAETIYLPFHGLAYDSSNEIYFAYNISGTAGLTFVDPGSDAFNGATNSNSVSILTKFQSGTKSVQWRTKLMDGDGFNNRVYDVKVENHKLIIGGLTFDETMPLVQGDPTLFSGSKPEDTFANIPSNQFASGFLMLFNINNFDLIHSTYFGGNDAGGLGTNDIRAVAGNQFNELFVFGHTRTRYDVDNTDKVGIPVFNNGIAGAYFQSNLNNDLNLSDPDNDGFGFKFCFNDTPLNINQEFTNSKGSNFELYPNPLLLSGSSNQLSISSSQTFSEIMLFDLSGRALLTEQIPLVTEYRFILDRFLFPSGAYVIQLKGAGWIESQKLIVLD